MTQATTAQSRTGWILSGLVILFMLFDSLIKFFDSPEVYETTVNQLGFAAQHIPVLGTISLVCTLLYAIPRTAVWGALLSTAYLGGAVAVHLRVDNPLFSHTLFPVYLGILLWAGLGLRDTRVRRLFGFGN